MYRFVLENVILPLWFFLVYLPASIMTKYIFLDKITRVFLGIAMLMTISGTAFAISNPSKNGTAVADSLVKAYRNQSVAFEKEGNYEEALHCMRKCDSLLLHKTMVIIPQEEARNQKTSKVHLMIVILVIIDLVGLVFFFYLEKKRAYKKLVKKNIEWAAQDRSVEVTTSVAAETITEDKDLALTRQLMLMFEKDKIFLDDNVNLNTIAQRLNTNRNVMSRIINSKFQKNFAALMNEYRIKEAVRLLNDEQNKKYTMQAISEMCGYKNRQVFYVAFKKETGVTPTEFVKMNLSKDFDED